MLFGRDYRIGHFKEVISGFFIGIKNFIAEGINEKVDEQMTILLDNSIISLKTMKDLETDVVLITDSEDIDSLNLWFARIFSILNKNLNLFKDWNGMINKFSSLSADIDSIANDANETNFTLLFSSETQVRT